MPYKNLCLSHRVESSVQREAVDQFVKVLVTWTFTDSAPWEWCIILWLIWEGKKKTKNYTFNEGENHFKTYVNNWAAKYSFELKFNRFATRSIYLREEKN